MLTTFLDAFFFICSQCVPVSSGPKRKSTNYPKHIVKLRTKCKRLSKCKHLPNGMYKWRAAQTEHMLAVQQLINVNSRERTILQNRWQFCLYKYIIYRRVCKEGVAPPPPLNTYGELAVGNTDKASELNRQFSMSYFVLVIKLYLIELHIYDIFLDEHVCTSYLSSIHVFYYHDAFIK